MTSKNRISLIAIYRFLAGLLIALSTLSGAANAQNPVPLINQPLVPDAVKPGGAGFTLTVNGTSFVLGAVVNWNGSPLATTFVSGSQLTASVPASDVAQPGTASVNVVNPSGGSSNVTFFEVTPPTPTIALAATIGTGTYPGIYPSSVTVGDFNRDGTLDLAVANIVSNNISVLLGKGDGAFQAAVNYDTGSGPTSVAAGDFNGDGKLDLVTANFGQPGSGVSPDNVSVLLGNGDGTFQAAVNYNTGSFPKAVAVGDFNGDGKLDLVTANYSSNNMSVLLGKGDGTFQAAVNYNTGSFPKAVAVGDFNGDGKLDLVTANSNNISVLLGNGDGTFQAAVNYSTGSDAVAVGDFNGDGKLDLVTANSNNISLLLGNGDGTFQAAVNYDTGSGPTSVAVGDFNGDGRLDVVTANYYSNDVSVLLGNGDGTFQGHADYSGILHPESLAVGDFNGDGRLDVAVPFTIPMDQVGILLQAPTVTISTATLSFADQVIGTRSAQQVVTLSNTSVLSLRIDSRAVTGTNTSDFSETNTCGSGLPPGGECGITVTFVPTKLGPRMASVTITDNAAGSPETVALSGTGVVSGPNVTLSGTSLTFATQLVGTTSPTQSVTLNNYGNSALNIATISFTGADPGDFHQANTCGSSVAPGASCTINVTFNPTQRGARTATLSIPDNAPGNPQTVSLGGTGTVVQINPVSLGFGVVTPFKTATLSTTVTNVGSITLSIRSIAITGMDTDEFSQTNTCGSTVAAGRSCAVTVTFRPREGWTDSAVVSISDDGGGSPQQVPLVGFGCIPLHFRPCR